MARGLAAAALVAALPFAATGAAAADPGPTAARDRDGRRRWALARMDEMAQERLRCHDRFRTPREIRECQVDFERRYRAYNEMYLEALRD